MICPFEPDDLILLSALQPANWSPISPNFELYLSHPMFMPIKTVLDQRLVGVANASLFGDTAWLSHIIVHPDCQGQGIGGAMVRHLVSRLDALGIRTTSLIATEFGLPVYLKQGFIREVEYGFHQAPPEPGPSLARPGPAPKPSDFQASDRAAVLELDRKVSGEQRQDLLDGFLPAAKLLKSKGSLDGFWLPGLREGLIIARTPEAGQALLQEQMKFRDRIVLPVANTAGQEVLRAAGYRETSRSWRMYRGEPLIWQPKCLFSRIGGNFG